MANPFADPHTQRARFASPYPASPVGYNQATRGYPPQSYPTAYDHRTGDVGYGRRPAGVTVNGQTMPWVAGEDDDERKPLTSG